MSVKIIVGAQWGDEGKGKVIDIMASCADVVVRSQGGNNAGHTIKVNDATYKLHLVPSGILYKKAMCVLGCGVVIDPRVLVDEIQYLESNGLSFDNFKIDPRAHVIMPWHITLDKAYEKARMDDRIGTTSKGIGPCYMDKAKREGIRMYDLINPTLLERKAKKLYSANMKIARAVCGAPIFTKFSIIFEKYCKFGQYLRRYVDDTSVIVYRAIQKKKSVLFEGAQGALLDLDMGTYPFVTSSHPTSSGACQGVGIGPTFVDEVIGIAKAYTTRVGEGPFPTELNDELGDTIRNVGNEYGTTTGRARRVGWFDAVVARHAVRVNGLTSLVINKLDVLSGIPKLKICVAYRLADGTTTEEFPPAIEQMEHCEPIYEELDGFDEDVSSCRSFDNLPVNARKYIKRIAVVCGCDISMIGVGPSRNQIINM